MSRGQEAANNGMNPEALPQLRCFFSCKTLFILILTILTTAWVIFLQIYTIILVCVNFEAGTPFSAAEQKELVDEHNKVRANVTPPAKDMQKMEWDNDMAKLAQRWADKCQYPEHGDVLNNFGSIGQNMWASSSMKDLVTWSAHVWWSERTINYNYATNKCSNRTGAQCGHYTQAVFWAKSNKLGCGRSAKGCDGGATIIVCNYYPAGNFPWRPYRT